MMKCEDCKYWMKIDSKYGECPELENFVDYKVETLEDLAEVITPKDFYCEYFKEMKTSELKRLKNRSVLSTTEATIWANEWLRAIKEHPNIPQDKGAMIEWFANAIMVGYDAGRKAGEALNLDTEPNHGDCK